MLDYKAPMRDVQFVMEEMLDFEAHYQRLGYVDATPDTVTAILEEAARSMTHVIAPLNQSGDEQGCSWENGVVTTPNGFKEAYQQYVEAGWPSLCHPVEFGGQEMPESLGSVLVEFTDSANFSWGMYLGLSHGAINMINNIDMGRSKN